MNIGSILKTVGMGLLSASPFGAVAIPLINAILPDDKKLSANATGDVAIAAIKQLPPEEQRKLNLAEINLLVKEEEGRTARYQAMTSSDGQETRAKQVNKAMNALIVISIAFMAATAYVYVKHGAEAAFSIEMAGVFLTVTGTFTYVIRAYFGDLRTETKSRHATIDDKPQPLGLLASLLSRK